MPKNKKGEKVELDTKTPIEYWEGRTGNPCYGKAILHLKKRNRIEKRIIEYEIALNHQLETSNGIVKIVNGEMEFIFKEERITSEILNPVRYVMIYENHENQIPNEFLEFIKEGISEIYREIYSKQRKEWLSVSQSISQRV